MNKVGYKIKVGSSRAEMNTLQLPKIFTFSVTAATFSSAECKFIF